jgi:hypothetical protein
MKWVVAGAFLLLVLWPVGYVWVTTPVVGIPCLRVAPGPRAAWERFAPC